MDHASPSSEQWKEAYDLVLRVKELAPWGWMRENDIFGVRDPETENLCFVSTMGTLGEHFAVSVYPDVEALYELQDFAENGPNPERLLEIPQFQVSFGSRDQLDKEDHKVIKSLGYKFRGRNAWPLFRSYRPGFAPWLIEADELRVLTTALEQLLDVAPRVRDEPALLEPLSEEDYLVRTRSSDGSWSDERIDVPPRELPPLDVSIDPDLVARLKELPRRAFAVEVELALTPSPLRDEGPRPYFPYMLFVVESKQGIMLGVEVLQPLPSLVEMRNGMAAVLGEVFLKVQTTPAQIIATDDRLLDVLEPLADPLGIALLKASNLPAVESTKDSLFAFSGF